MSNPNVEDKPPVFKSWKGWYWVVLSVALLQFLVYYWLTQSFS